MLHFLLSHDLLVLAYGIELGRKELFLSVSCLKSAITMNEVIFLLPSFSSFSAIVQNLALHGMKEIKEMKDTLYEHGLFNSTKEETELITLCLRIIFSVFHSVLLGPKA